MSKLYKILFLNLFIIVLFLGCTPPSAFSFFKKDELKANALQYTKVSKIVSNRHVKATFNATYLNSVDSDFDDENQNFIVGVFLSENNTTNDENYIDDRYYISMNDRNATSSSRLDEEHKMYGHIPIYNSWADYYVIKFDTNESDTNLNLSLNLFEKKVENNTIQTQEDNTTRTIYKRPETSQVKIKTTSVTFEVE